MGASRSSVLLRLWWMLLGPMALFTLALSIPRHGLTWRDPLYAVTLFLIVGGRCRDVTFGQGPLPRPKSAVRLARRFAIRFTLLAGWAWLAAHALGRAVG